MRKTTFILAVLVMVLVAGAAWAADGNVKVTPLGSHDGELCAVDRALILEDPDGTRILYDAGRTVRGRRIRVWARSMPCSSATCTETIWVTRSSRPRTPASAAGLTSR